MIARLVLALATCAILFGYSASAQPQAPDFAGSWTFKAWVGSDCEFTGLAHISPVPNEDDTYTCELTAHQACGVQSWTVRQTCSATASGNQLSVRSEIVEFIGSDPTPSYLPDNFLLTVASPRRMFGALHSVNIYKAEWIRDEGVTS